MSPPSWTQYCPLLKWAGWLCVIGLVASSAAILGPRASAAQPAGDADAGRDVYVANCAMCHGTDATGMMGMHPALRGAVQRLTVEGVEVTIRNGRQTMPPMPAFAGRLSDREIADVIAYLDTLPPGARNFGPEMDRDGMMRDGGMGRGWNWMGPLAASLLLLLLAAVVILVVTLLTQRGKQAPRNGQQTAESPRDILDRRYADGELSREEYRQAREELER